ncbi:hypothetical protein GGR51DRAFT_533099 [Nemania sp. FL0031]|nr:hypothetical protein GGR51DRAFT_533099 [Nemania sp. FL0031]
MQCMVVGLHVFLAKPRALPVDLLYRAPNALSTSVVEPSAAFSILHDALLSSSNTLRVPFSCPSSPFCVSRCLSVPCDALYTYQISGATCPTNLPPYPIPKHTRINSNTLYAPYFHPTCPPYDVFSTLHHPMPPYYHPKILISTFTSSLRYADRL